MAAQEEKHAQHEIAGVERRLRWAFLLVLALCIIVLTLAALLLVDWRALGALMLGLIVALASSALILTLYAFDSLHRTARQVRQRLEALTFIDPATEVYNYRYIQIRLAEEAERVRRYRGVTSILYLDLDGFKQVNDRFGHPRGDTVLAEIARALRRNTRSCDILGRVGGDEFLVILPDTTPEHARSLAERAIQTVRDYSCETPSGARIDFLTCKAGVAAFPVNGEHVRQVVRAADDAVYEAKARGGNQVAVAAGIPPDSPPDRTPTPGPPPK
jgi:diguanylate cyclase (GGDEF)-like protein